MSKELPIPKDMMERFKDISQPHITQMDTLETALVISSELGKRENYEFVKSLIQVEETLKNNELFKSVTEMADKIKKSFEPPQEIKDYVENQKKASQMLYESNRVLIDSTNKLRSGVLKNILPNVQLNDAMAMVSTILSDGMREAIERSEYHRKKAQELEIAIKEIDDQVEVEKYKAEYKMHTEEAIKYMELVQPYEPMTVSKHGKQLEKDLQPLIIRDTTKDSADGGITYKQKKKLLKVRKKYDRLILTKSRKRAKNILMKDEGWTLGTLNKNLTKGKKLLQK